MNKIYKSIWNHVTRTFTAVSEITLVHNKISKSNCKRIKQICLILGNSLMALNVYAASWTLGQAVNLDQENDDGISNVAEKGGFSLGGSNPAKYYTENVIINWGGADNVYELKFNGAGSQTAIFDIDNSNNNLYDLFEQSTGFQ